MTKGSSLIAEDDVGYNATPQGIKGGNAEEVLPLVGGEIEVIERKLLQLARPEPLREKEGLPCRHPIEGLGRQYEEQRQQRDERSPGSCLRNHKGWQE